VPVHILPFDKDLTAFCADKVVADLAEQLPDLSNAIIFVPEATAHIRAQFIALRKSLLDSAQRLGCHALIPPTITTPRQLFFERYEADNKNTKSLSAKLSLAIALHQYKDLFPHADRWRLADEIISVFNNISENAYVAEQADYDFEKNIAALDTVWRDDTRMLVALWHTWKDLYDEKNYPLFAWYKMLVTDTYTAQHEQVYLCGMKNLSPCFERWASNLYTKGRLTWIAKANTAPIPVACHPLRETLAQLTKKAVDPDVFADSGTDYSRFLDRVFSSGDSLVYKSIPFAERARQFAKECTTSPLAGRVRLFFPMTIEEHAWGIYIAVRRWLEHRHQSIALVSLDRRLSRRIRAIFEKRNIPLIDYSGWELSTTSSATALMHMLNDADDTPIIKTFLALLRSSFCDLDIAHEDAVKVADHIEYLIGRHQIQHRSINKTVEQLKKVLRDNPSSIELCEKIINALSSIEKFRDRKEHPHSDYFECLFKAMKKLGMYEKLAADSAGKKLISELQKIYQAVKMEKEQAHFNIWRNLILHHLENSNFRPVFPDQGVFLMNPEQAELMQFDALAIVALDHRHLPSQPRSGLINENIRRELDLETYEQSVGKQFLLFRTLLESAEHLLLSCQQYANNRKLMPSAWLSAIHHFHKIAYGDITDYELRNTAKQCSALNLGTEQGIRAQIQSIAKPIPSPQLWPKKISVNAYQNIIDCPYRFYARYLLKIRSRPKVSDYWEATNYGTYLHECLQKLHQRLDDLYKLPIWLAERRKAIVDEAHQILHTQFKKSASNNYANYLWLNDAQDSITYYIDWMIQLQQAQAILATQTEVELGKELAQNLYLMGFADLMLQTDNGVVLIDYKTGSLVRKKDIQTGEHIQLLSYALLDDNIKTAIYLGLGAKNRGEQREIDGDSLIEYRDKNQQRMLDIKCDYDAQQPLSAWGNKQNVCKYCDYAGLCRRPTWDEYHDWTSAS